MVTIADVKLFSSSTVTLMMLTELHNLIISLLYKTS